MIVSDLLRAGLALLIPFLVPFNILWLYVMVALSSAIVAVGGSERPSRCS